MKDAAFFAHCVMSMTHEFDETVPTAATDGKGCFYNTDFFMKLTPEERMGLVLHETMHPAMLHFERQGTRDGGQWNIAGDYSINDFILGAGFKLPDGALYDKKYTGWTVEKIFNDVVQNKMKMPEQLKDMRPPDPGPGNKQAQDELKAHWDDILIQAAQVSKMRGDKPGAIPGAVQMYIDSLLNPEVPWHRVLASFMTRMLKTDYTFRKPNRRYRPRFILPSQFSEAVCDITVAVDTSGSVRPDQFHHFVSETAAIIKNMRPQNLHFMCFDTSVKTVDTLKDLRDLHKVKFTGRGGTKIDPVMEYAKKEKPSVMIVFTDGHYTPPKVNPKVPVLWVVNDNQTFKAPFGKHIKYTFKEAA